MSRRERWRAAARANPWRLTPLRALIIVAAVLIAGFILNWADEPIGDVPAPGHLGEAVEVSDGQFMRVEAVRAATTVYDFGREPLTTPGVFLILRTTTWTEEVSRYHGLRCRLQQDGREIESSTQPFIQGGLPAAGFTYTDDFTYELPADPDWLLGAELRCFPHDELNSITRRAEIDLGLDDDTVAALLDHPGVAVTLSRVTRVTNP